MTLPNLRQIEKLAIDNSPALLTAIGVVGTIGTAVLTGRAMLRAERVLIQEINRETYKRASEDDYELVAGPSRKERTKLVWKCYIPPVVSGTFTIVAIVGANHIGSKRAAAVAAAYTISEKAYSEYREKVIEKFGETKERSMRDDLVADQVARNPLSESNVVIMGNGDVLCCDLFSGRYFDSSVESIKKAMNDTNYQIMHGSYASLSDFYDRVGLPRTDYSEEVGWTQDKLLELEFSTTLASDGRPCVAYRFQIQPIRNYHLLH